MKNSWVWENFREDYSSQTLNFEMHYFITWWIFLTECWCNGLLNRVPLTYQEIFFGYRYTLRQVLHNSAISDMYKMNGELRSDDTIDSLICKQPILWFICFVEFHETSNFLSFTRFWLNFPCSFCCCCCCCC